MHYWTFGGYFRSDASLDFALNWLVGFSDKLLKQTQMHRGSKATKLQSAFANVLDGQVAYIDV